MEHKAQGILPESRSMRGRGLIGQKRQENSGSP